MTTRSGPLRRLVIPPKLPAPVSPAQIQHAEQRAADVQNRIADAITRFAGSMTFVYLHVVWFGAWIGLGVESYPFGLLTMIVSLEAIFLSTFVMISQNRADAVRQVAANQQWQSVQEILELTKAVHAYAAASAARVPDPSLEEPHASPPPLPVPSRDDRARDHRSASRQAP